MSDLDLEPAEAAVLDRLPDDLRDAHGVPDTATALRRRAGFARVVEVLGGLGHLEVSVLGPAWSSDVDVCGPVPAMSDAVSAAGWILLDDWLAAIGSSARQVWAVTDADGTVLTSVDLNPSSASDSTKPAAAAIAARARRRGEVRLREVLELIRLGTGRASAGPAATGDEVVDRAVREMAAQPAAAPVVLEPGEPAAAAAVTAAKRALRPRAVVALCGVDGAGKSTTSRGLAEALSACGIDVGYVWARPGMNIGVLDRVARIVKRSSGQDDAPGVREVATGGEVASRQGLLGWAWSLLVVLAFAVDVRRQHRRARGVVIYDRHLPDAMATLDVLYGGGPKRLHRWIVRRALPPAGVSAYLRIDAQTAVLRKPDDTIGLHAVRAQLEAYETLLADVPRLLVLDATEPPAAIVRGILEASPPIPLRSRLRHRLR